MIFMFFMVGGVSMKVMKDMKIFMVGCVAPRHGRS